jgi:hypothetical protein
MQPEMWANRGLIPATVQLLQVYFRVAAAHLVTHQYHVKILNIFQRLIKKRATEECVHSCLRAFACVRVPSCLPACLRVVGPGWP